MYRQSEKTTGVLSPKLKLADTRDRAWQLDPVDGLREGSCLTDSAPDPIEEEMQFCDWAFARLGHIAVFRFSEGGFMLLAENGERTRGDTLAMALLAMLESQGLNTCHLVYHVADDDSRAA